MPDIHASEFTVNGVSWGQPITINWQPLDDSGWATHLRAFQPQPEPEPDPVAPSSALAGVEEVGEWIAGRVQVDHHLGRIRLPIPVNSWSDVQNVCDGNAYVDRASVHFGRPCSEPHFGFWNAATDHAAELLGSVERPARAASFLGDGAYAQRSHDAAVYTANYSATHDTLGSSTTAALQGLSGVLCEAALGFTCVEANLIARLYSAHGLHSDAQIFMRHHVEDDTDDHEECCEDHRAWYP